MFGQRGCPWKFKTVRINCTIRRYRTTRHDVVSLDINNRPIKAQQISEFRNCLSVLRSIGISGEANGPGRIYPMECSQVLETFDWLKLCVPVGINVNI